MNPYQPVIDFENVLAEYCGSKYAIAVESCSAAILLCLMYRKKEMGGIGNVTIPSKTYPSIPCSIIHAGGKVKWEHGDWDGQYELYPLRIWDAALRFKRGMYSEKMKVFNAFQCISFHLKKHLPIGRGGAILTDDEMAAQWLRLARFDGREPMPLQEQKEFTVLGFNVYMQPDQAARGLQIFQMIEHKDLADLKVEDQKYCDLSLHKIYTQ